MPNSLSEITLAVTQPPQDDHGWRRIVRGFTPSMFSITMGTGVVAILIHQMPYNSSWTNYPCYIVFGLNVLIFVSALLISILRYALWPELWPAMINHPTHSLFLGCFPMGLGTIVNLIVLVCVPAWGRWAATMAWALWWIDAALAVTICCSVAFLMISVHEVTPEKLTAACLLPAVSCLVAASTGGQVAQMEALQAHEALWTLLTCYCCWAIGFFVGLMILCIYFYRLLLFKLPSQEVVVSVFLSLGPLGQGSFGILQCGKAAKMIFPKLTVLPSEAGTILYVMGLIMGLVIWAMAIPWMCFAVGSVLRLKFRFPFNIGWWAFLYPVGGVASATITLSAELDSAFFGVVAEVLTAIIVLVWIICFVGTIRGAFTGELFPKPGVCELRPDSGAKVNQSDASKTRATRINTDHCNE
ncbi:sulfite efflux pump SSU1 [Aureobasidium melanogenum CBS 110374]|uniref:Sulfite efflux pump SSU1 n=1 Tax=Aureobasidium melanogenum (strain CBS 110374) TaxID=1043003 RepID=A0A074WRJ3_AURM1|nr:sulfite efflux pump SSU1 [Aureobasidium melanogenum CBS 110374]KEQ65046.1 sulfite efflux pump SSU1 [Aureobasidium melanogenum CBS 110374]